MTELKTLTLKSMRWSLNKWVFGSSCLAKHNLGFLVTSGCLFSRKVWWAVRISSFWRKTVVFYRAEWTKEGEWVGWVRAHKNEFQIQKSGKRKKDESRWKNWGHSCRIYVLFLRYVPWIIKKVFGSFVLNTARNLSLLKQFTYMHPKVLVMYF